MKTLVIIDVQNDFIPGGSLAVPEGDQIVALINKLQEEFDLVIAT
ncbi:MAG: isochorismatase family protein, partial [Gillisia sp.]|nr:isochorismatase family protein [Gillisia sp.]